MGRIIIVIGNDFLDMASKAQETKLKICKSDFFKIENSYASNDTFKQVKRQLTRWQKILEIMTLTTHNKKTNNFI